LQTQAKFDMLMYLSQVIRNQSHCLSDCLWHISDTVIVHCIESALVEINFEVLSNVCDLVIFVIGITEKTPAGFVTISRVCDFGWDFCFY
jgi:hypothetical protein